MKKHNLLVLASLVCALSGGAVHAEKADRNKPMNVEADNLRYDDLKQTSIFTGRVVVTKGTILIRGARVDVRQDAEGFQFGVVTAEPGKLAFYRQKRDNIDEFIEGEAETIEYDGKTDRIKFIKRAELRRFKGAAPSDEMTGSLITYDNTTDVFTVDGNTSSTGAAAPGGRIRAVLTPKSVPAAGAASGPAVPASPATPATPAAPPAQLRPSTTMGGERK